MQKNKMTDNYWTVTHSRYPIRDQWLTVRADSCRMPDGTGIAPYYVLEYPPWVAVVAMTASRELVLVREYRHGLGQTILGLPCGNVAPGETATEAAHRELREETGYGGKRISELGRLSPNPATHANLLHCFLIKPVSPVTIPDCDPTEKIETVLMTVDQLAEQIAEGKFCHALHLAALFLALDQLQMK